MQLPWDAFRRLHESYNRLEAQQKIEQTHLSAAAAQASGKDIKDMLKPYKKMASVDGIDHSGKGPVEFMKAMGGKR